MRTKYKHEKKTNAVTAIGIGTVVSVMITVVLAMIAGSLILRETVAENADQFLIPVIHAISTYVGCFVSSRMTDEKNPAAIFGTAATYYVLLVGITILMFDSAFTGVLTGLLSVLVGAVVSFLLGVRKVGRSGRKRVRIRV